MKMKMKKYRKSDEEEKIHAHLMAIDWDNPAECLKDVDSRQYMLGMQIEGEEHADVAHGDIGIVHKIVMAHLKEDKEYYTKLAKMEKSTDNDKEED
jgi:hypothetical protein